MCQEIMKCSYEMFVNLGSITSAMFTLALWISLALAI